MTPLIRFTVLCGVLSVFASCESSGPGKYTNMGVLLPDPNLIGAQLTVAIPVLATPSLVVCSANSTIVTPVDVVIVPTRDPFAIESVTLHMIDGTNIGGAGITFPSSRLAQMFGTTIIDQRRVLSFQPAFICGSAVPTAVVANVVVVDRAGATTTLTATAALGRR